MEKPKEAISPDSLQEKRLDKTLKTQMVWKRNLYRKDKRHNKE